jgi:hypothetical protein
MKSYIKQLLRESLLAEKISNIDIDVNMLYDMYFKDDIDEIGRTGMVTDDMFKMKQTNTSILKDDESLLANENNKCNILINYGRNFYSPSKKLISLSVDGGGKDYVMGFGGNINDATESLTKDSQRNNLPREFTEEKIKGSIHHELAHWIDDTMNNQHIKKRLDKAMELNTANLGGVPVIASKMEIQGQIHNVKQLKNKYENNWDNLTFVEMLRLSPALNTVYRDLPYKFKVKWIRDLKTRMYREGLLGKNMVN